MNTRIVRCPPSRSSGDIQQSTFFGMKNKEVRKKHQEIFITRPSRGGWAAVGRPY
jgi:hypothetical protein